MMSPLQVVVFGSMHSVSLGPAAGHEEGQTSGRLDEVRARRPLRVASLTRVDSLRTGTVSR